MKIIHIWLKCPNTFGATVYTLFLANKLMYRAEKIIHFGYIWPQNTIPRTLASCSQRETHYSVEPLQRACYGVRNLAITNLWSCLCQNTYFQLYWNFWPCKYEEEKKLYIVQIIIIFNLMKFCVEISLVYGWQRDFTFKKKNFSLPFPENHFFWREKIWSKK